MGEPFLFPYASAQALAISAPNEKARKNLAFSFGAG